MQQAVLVQDFGKDIPLAPAEERNVPFKFAKHFRYSYEGRNIVCYEPGQIVDVSAACAREATRVEAGHAVHVNSELGKQLAAPENKQAQNPAAENKSGIGLASTRPGGWKR